MTTTNQAMLRRLGARLLLSVVAAAMLTTTGCEMNEPYSPTGPGKASQAAETLKALPSLEDTEAQVRGAIEQIGAEAASIAPSLVWRWHHEPSQGGCSPPFEKSDGQLILMAKYISDTPVPDGNWDQILAVAQAAAAKLGATQREVFKDAPGDHDVRFYNQTGTAIRIGSQKAALISGSTGCRLPRGDASS